MPKKVEFDDFHIGGKDLKLAIVCKSPDGLQMYKHKVHNDGFRRYCLECGTTENVDQNTLLTPVN